MVKLIQLVILFVLMTRLGAENILRLSCKTESTFYKIASNYALNDANTKTLTSSYGLAGCIDFCVSNQSCKAFNFKNVSDTEALCELLQNDRTTKANDVTPKAGWSYYDTGLFSSQIGQYCRSLSYNPCYPCLCIDSCEGNTSYSCNCTADSPPLPYIYAAFETSLPTDATKTAYDRGQDVNGNSVISLVNGATVGISSGRPGKVLRIIGTNAGAVIGNFNDNFLNNPSGTKSSISFWLRVVTPYSSYQTVYGSGNPSYNTGILLRVNSNARYIFARSLLTSKQLNTPPAMISDTLKTWSHIVVTCNWDSPKLEIYVNGRSVTKTTSTPAVSLSNTGHPNLIFGAGALYPLIGDHWNMHMDDFAVWQNRILTPDEITYLMNKGFVKTPED